MSRAREFADLAGSVDAGGITGKNLIINGSMQVWQRSVSATLVSAGTYLTADRWKYWAGGATLASARTAFTVGQTDVPNFEYYKTLTIGANSGVGDYATFNQHIENVIQSDAQTFTLSFYAKASQSWTIGLEPIQNFGSGGSARVLGSPQNVTVGTSWERHSITFTTTSISGKTLGTGHNFELAIWLSGGSSLDARTGSIGNQSGTFDITGVQLEVGEQATPFEHRSYGDELAACQRYTYVPKNDSTSASDGSTFAVGYCQTGSVGVHFTDFPVPMRDIPTLATTSTAGAIEQGYHNATATSHNVTAMSYVPSISGNQKACFLVGSASFSGGEGVHCRYSTGNIADNIIVFSSEL